MKTLNKQSMNSGVCLVLMLICISSCAPLKVTPPEDIGSLTSGKLLFGEVVDISDIDSGEILATDDEMRKYISDRVGKHRYAKLRLKKLLSAMVEDGLLSLDYDLNLTHTAMETFHKRQGNCLSFSNLFVALAREADLEVSFQMVEIPPSFATNGELMILNHHINILVKGIRSDTNFKQDFVVDFNTAEYNGYYKTRKVADDDAIALYFSNVGVESMQAGESLQAFRYLKKAIHVSPSIPSLWVNLGALYSQHNLYQSAVQAYQQALVNQPSNKSALVNLANTLNHMGRHEEAQYYLGRVEYYRNHNPYYHYFLAKTSYAKNNYGSSLQHLTKAISLKRDEHQFHHLQGLTHYRLEDYERSSRSFERARKAALEDQQIAGYLKKLQALATRLN